MARPLRITCPGAFYHVTYRGNERKDIFDEVESFFKKLFLLSPTPSLSPIRRVKDKTRKDKKLERKISKIEKKV